MNPEDVIAVELIRLGILNPTQAEGQKGLIRQAVQQGRQGQNIISYYQQYGLEDGAARLAGAIQNTEAGRIATSPDLDAVAAARRAFEATKAQEAARQAAGLAPRTSGFGGASSLTVPPQVGSPAAPGGNEARIAQLEAQTGLKFLGQTSDGRVVMSDPLNGDQFIYEDANGQFVFSARQKLGDGSGGGGQTFAPETYTTSIINGQVYTKGSREDTPRPTGIMVDPEITSTSIDRNGNLIGVKSDGSVTTLMEGFDFAGVDPERAQAVSESVPTGFFNGAPTLAREEFGETSEYNRANLAETARRANLQAATSAFGNVVSSAAPLGQLGLDQNKFAAEIMRNAPDYLARAFFQQGGTSPLPQVGQAEIINSVRDYVNQINQTLAGFNPQVGAFQPMAPFVQPPPIPVTETFIEPGRTIEPAPVKAPDAAAGFNMRAPYEAAIAALAAKAPTPAAQTFSPSVAAPTQTFSTAPARVAPTTPSAPTIGNLPVDQRQLLRMENGGHGFNMVITGDSSDGKPNEELVIDMPGDAGMAVIPMDDIKHAPKKKKGGKVPYAAEGGFFGFNIPQIPTVAGTTNEQLRGLEASVRPPAINQIMSGGLAGSPRFGFDLFTPQQIRSLTPETRDALGTTLATQFNETLENVEFAQQQRFGAKRNQGTARQIAGFI